MNGYHRIGWTGAAHANGAKRQGAAWPAKRATGDTEQSTFVQQFGPLRIVNRLPDL